MLRMLAKYVEKKAETCSTMKEFNLPQLQKNLKKLPRNARNILKPRLIYKFNFVICFYVIIYVIFAIIINVSHNEKRIYLVC